MGRRLDWPPCTRLSDAGPAITQELPRLPSSLFQRSSTKRAHKPEDTGLPGTGRAAKGRLWGKATGPSEPRPWARLGAPGNRSRAGRQVLSVQYRTWNRGSPSKYVRKQNELSQSASRPACPEPQLWACWGYSLNKADRVPASPTHTR